MADDFELRVAYHEAAHGLMAHALGLTLDRVQVGDNPRFDLVDKLGPERRRDHARVLAAGPAGEELLFGNALGGGSDDPEIERLLQYDAETEGALRWEVKLFLAGNVPPLRRIADALLRDGVLDGDQVEQLVRATSSPSRRSVPMRRRI
jgi:hypothetical protein